MEILVVFVVYTKPKGVFELRQIVAACKTDVVAPGMAKTGFLRKHDGIDTGVHDAIKSANL